MNLENFQLFGNSEEPNVGDRLIGYGFPRDDSFEVAQRQHSPDTFSFARAARPVPWHSTVIAPLPFQGFDEYRHYLIAWDPDIIGRHPHGYSGSAVWLITQQTGGVWHSTLKFCGIATSFHRSQKAERIVRASAVVKFLTDTFGAPD
jgi:hypothetical protein